MELWSDWPTSTSNSTRRSSSHWLLRPAPYFVLGSCHCPGCSVRVAVARCVLHSLHWLKGITSDYLLRCAWTFQVVQGQWSKQLSFSSTDNRHLAPCPPRPMPAQKAPESPRKPAIYVAARVRVIETNQALRGDRIDMSSGEKQLHMKQVLRAKRPEVRDAVSASSNLVTFCEGTQVTIQSQPLFIHGSVPARSPRYSRDAGKQKANLLQPVVSINPFLTRPLSRLRLCVGGVVAHQPDPRAS